MATSMQLSGWKAACVLCVVLAAIGSSAQTLTTLVNFNGANGATPGSLIQATDGNLWGTTNGGGSSNCGTVFLMTPSGTLKTNFDFDCSSTGSTPAQGLVQGSDNNFYGTTILGGDHSNGTVFKLTRGGLTVLNSFYFKKNGASPLGALIEGTDGMFYGTTYLGGSSGGWGTLYRVDPKNGAVTTLYAFDFTHGAEPYAGLVQATDGAFYGTTSNGGAYGGGTVFKIASLGKITVLYNFGQAANDPLVPLTSLTQGTDGLFYGSTKLGGSTSNDGALFSISSSGTFTTLYSFSGNDGRYPNSALLQATDGNFYGTTAYGGTNDQGAIFRLTPAGILSTLYNFSGLDGALPLILTQDTNGLLYGLTGEGGLSGQGTAFSLSIGLGPFVRLLPSSGQAARSIKILGTNLTGATSVTFNGTPATFSVASSALINATVPAGATTGPVQVVTPSGTLTSNTIFRVR